MSHNQLRHLFFFLALMMTLHDTSCAAIELSTYFSIVAPAIHPKQLHPVMWGEWHPFEENAKLHANIFPTRTCPLHSLEPWEEGRKGTNPQQRSFNSGDHRCRWIDMDFLTPWNAPKKQWGQWLPEPICGTWPFFFKHQNTDEDWVGKRIPPASNSANSYFIQKKW